MVGFGVVERFCELSLPFSPFYAGAQPVVENPVRSRRRTYEETILTERVSRFHKSNQSL